MANEKRLIDANALIEEINQQRRASRTSFPRQSYVVGDVLTNIYNSPAVDAVEVVHGRWIPVIDGPTPLKNWDTLVGYECSVCKRFEEQEEPYCNCGAKMDGCASNGN